MRKQLEAALRDSDLGLVETQPLDRAGLAALRAGGARDVAARTAGALADELEPTGDPRAAPRAPRAVVRSGRRTAQRRWPWLALALAAVAGVAAAITVMARPARYRSTVQIPGVALTRGVTAGKLTVETDSAVEPAELARLYTSTLDALRLYVKQARPNQPLEIADPVDVLLGVPAAALCEPSAYFDGQAPRNCAAAQWATAIGARGTHRLMVVSDPARLVEAVRHGVAEAVCEFSAVEVHEICDITGRFAESSN
jgi:hypothetical protein